MPTAVELILASSRTNIILMEKYPPIAAWDISSDLVQLSGGHRNRVFRTVGLPIEKVLKSTRRSPGAIEWLLQVHDLARQSGILVPQLQKSNEGRLVEQGWTCEEYVQGEPIAGEALPDILPLINSFHHRSASIQQRPGFQSSAALLEQDEGGDVHFNGMPPNIVLVCRDAWRPLLGSPSAVVHGDLSPYNVIQTNTGIAIVDWDECRCDFSIFDIGQIEAPTEAEKRALLAWEVACSWWIEPEYAREQAVRLT